MCNPLFHWLDLDFLNFVMHHLAFHISSVLSCFQTLLPWPLNIHGTEYGAAGRLSAGCLGSTHRDNSAGMELQNGFKVHVVPAIDITETIQDMIVLQIMSHMLFGINVGPHEV